MEIGENGPLGPLVPAPHVEHRELKPQKDDVTVLNHQGVAMIAWEMIPFIKHANLVQQV